MQGNVDISFIVLTDSTAVNYRITRVTGTVLDSVALNTIKTIKKWVPATRNGVPVNYRYTFPFWFTIN